MPHNLTFLPVSTETFTAHFALENALAQAIANSGHRLQDGDILLVSSKIAAIAEGRLVALGTVQPSAEALALAEKYKLSPAMAQLVLQESDHIFGGIPGFVMSARQNVIAPNAGIDTSNVPAGHAVLYPVDSFATAGRIRAYFAASLGIKIGVVITDSRLMPGRTGTTGVALGVAGFDPVVDERGQPDLMGRPLDVTQRAVADNLCAAAQLLMGEAAEGIPAVITRHSNIPMTEDKRYSWRDLAIDWQLDLYVAVMGQK